MTHNASPEHVVDTNRPLLRLIVEALRRGTLHAQEYADWQDENIDRSLAPAHVRKGAKRYLIKKGQEVQNEEEIDEEEIDYETEYLSNLGLSISTPLVQIRILRSATNDMLPVPGPSKARQEFYTQRRLFDFDPEANEATAQPFVGPVRLVLHWSTDAEYNLERVYLACPKSGDLTRASVEAHWDWPIWRRHDVVSDGQAQAEVQDLDIKLYKTGTGE